MGTILNSYYGLFEDFVSDTFVWMKNILYMPLNYSIVKF